LRVGATDERWRSASLYVEAQELTTCMKAGNVGAGTGRLEPTFELNTIFGAKKSDPEIVVDALKPKILNADVSLERKHVGPADIRLSASLISVLAISKTETVNVRTGVRDVGVVAFVAENDIIPCTAIKRIIACPAHHDVRTGVTIEEIIPRTTGPHIVMVVRSSR
jgi:hypothetical protein